MEVADLSKMLEASNQTVWCYLEEESNLLYCTLHEKMRLVKLYISTAHLKQGQQFVVEYSSVICPEFLQFFF